MGCLFEARALSGAVLQMPRRAETSREPFLRGFKGQDRRETDRSALRMPTSSLPGQGPQNEVERRPLPGAFGRPKVPLGRPKGVRRFEATSHSRCDTSKGILRPRCPREWVGFPLVKATHEEASAQKRDTDTHPCKNMNWAGPNMSINTSHAMCQHIFQTKASPFW